MIDQLAQAMYTEVLTALLEQYGHEYYFELDDPDLWVDMRWGRYTMFSLVFEPDKLTITYDDAGGFVNITASYSDPHTTVAGILEILSARIECFAANKGLNE